MGVWVGVMGVRCRAKMVCREGNNIAPICHNRTQPPVANILDLFFFLCYQYFIEHIENYKGSSPRPPMTTITTAAIGFLAPFLPDLITAWHQRRDQRQELAILRLQLAFTQCERRRERRHQKEQQKHNAESDRVLGAAPLSAMHQHQHNPATTDPWHPTINQMLTQAVRQQLARCNPHAKTIATLSALVRPSITFGFFLLFVAVKIFFAVMLVATTQHPVNHHAPLSLSIAMTNLTPWQNILWDNNTADLFAGIIAFWFGDRMKQKYRTP